jgi:hypothetical protein
MSRLDALPPDQHAALALLLRQRKTYAEVAELLHISEPAIHDRAHAALAVLAPQQARALSAAQREEVGDFLLGQVRDTTALEDARAYLAGATPARAWARAVAAELAPLSDRPLREIPAEAPSATAEPPAGATPTQAPPVEPPAPLEPAAPVVRPASVEPAGPVPGPASVEPAPPETPAPPLESAPIAAAPEAPAAAPAPRAQGRPPAEGRGAARADTERDRPPAPPRATARRPRAEGRRDRPSGLAADAFDEDRPRRTRGSRRGGALLLAAIAAVVIAVVVIVLTRGGSSPHAVATTAATSASEPAESASTTTSTTKTTAKSAGPKTDNRFTLTASNPSSNAMAVVAILSEDGKHAFYISAEHLPPSKGFFYAVWLYNSATSNRGLGRAPSVGSNGRLEGGLLLPSSASKYHEMLLTKETSTTPTHPGSIVLKGPFALK